MKLQDLKALWTQFFFSPVSATGLGVFRFAIGLILSINIFLLWPDRFVWFSEQGVLTGKLAHQLLNSPRLDLFQLFTGSPGWINLFFSIYALVALSLTLGVGSRWASIVAFLMTTSLHHRNIFILNSGDTLLRIYLFFLMVTPSGATFSVDSLIRQRKSGNRFEQIQIVPWGLRLIQIQLCFLYISTVFWKLKGDAWIDGIAVYYTLGLEEFQHLPLPAFAHSLWFSQVLTWFTLAVEFSLGLLVWVKELRPYVLFLGLILHLGLEYSLNVPLFQWICLSGFLLFVEEATWKKLSGLKSAFCKNSPQPTL
ncbi:MAG: deoxyribonuclease HsdR [Deltaproteobacteria bacterium]|nr:deoxyribonuclease HsdR [Deltaproteobacteria bacterium]